MTMRFFSNLLFVILCAMNICEIDAQTTYHVYNCYQRKVLVSFVQNNDGTYAENSKQYDVDVVDNVCCEYAYDEKHRNLYVRTNTANVQITLFDNKETKFKMKNSLVPKLEGSDLQNEINKQSNILKEKIQTINKHIQDSIKSKRDEELKERERKLKEKAYNDSLDKIYFDEHKELWNDIPINVTSLTCYDCRERIDFTDEIIHEDSVSFLGLCYVSQDKQFLYYTRLELGLLNIKRLRTHKLIIPNELKNYDKFQRHIRIFADSIKYYCTEYDFDDLMKFENEFPDELYSKEMQKIAPYGFVEDYSWNDVYGYVTLNFSYTNTNKKTIKYIKPYFQVTNDVNDIRGNGHFSGTGPLEQYETATWNWYYSNYYVAGDATKLRITKIVITYMDGSIKTLDSNHIVYK